MFVLVLVLILVPGDYWSLYFSLGLRTRTDLGQVTFFLHFLNIGVKIILHTEN